MADTDLACVCTIYINLYMINKETVKTIVSEWLQDKEYFLVDVDVTTDDRILVEIDHKEGVWIEDCAELSRYIEEHLNRDEEDYELEVGSAGLGQPFKVVQQYINCIGEEVEVLQKDGKKVSGILKSVEEPNFVVTVKEKKKLEGEIKRVVGKLSNEGFTKKAPKEIIDEEKSKMKKYEEMLEKVLQRLDEIKSK